MIFFSIHTRHESMNVVCYCYRSGLPLWLETRRLRHLWRHIVFWWESTDRLSLRFPLLCGDWASSLIQRWLEFIMRVRFSRQAKPLSPRTRVKAHNTPKQTDWTEIPRFVDRTRTQQCRLTPSTKLQRWHGSRLSLIRQWRWHRSGHALYNFQDDAMTSLL